METEQLRLQLAEPVTPAAGGARLRVRNSYDAGSTGTRRTLTWRAPTTSPNSGVIGNLATLRDRSRTATRNDGYAKNAIDVLVSEMIGTGIKPLSQADDRTFRKQVQDLWTRWTDESAADGLLDWYGLQSQATRAWLEAGEVFVRLRPRFETDRLSVPLQIEVLEAEFCPHTYTTTLKNGHKVLAGIEFNRIGKRVAYWFYQSRPGDILGMDYSNLVRVVAESVIHLFDPLRPGQIRGVPHLTQALIRLYERDKFDDAALLRQQLMNMLVGFLKRPQTLGEETINPLTGLATETDAEGRPLLPLEPGSFQELAPGEEVQWSEPPETGPGYKDFNRQQLQHVAAATGVPYELLSGDLSGLNDRVIRVMLHRFRRRLLAWQHQIIAFQWCRPVWSTWLDRAILYGKLPAPAGYATDPWPWARVKWSPQGWPYLHPVQDVEAAIKAMRAGLGSRSGFVSELGEDAEDIDLEQHLDNERADELGLRYDSDGRQSPGTAASNAAEGEPDPTPVPTATAE